MESGTSRSRSDLTFNPIFCKPRSLFSRKGKSEPDKCSTCSRLFILSRKLTRYPDGQALSAVKCSFPDKGQMQLPWLAINFPGSNPIKVLSKPCITQEETVRCQWAEIQLKGIEHNCLKMFHPRKFSGLK